MGQNKRGSIHAQTQDIKATLGRFTPLFAGHDQQDGSEALNTMINHMSGDLYKWPTYENGEVVIEKRPYITETKTKDRDDAAAAKEAWQKHLLRNGSHMQDCFCFLYKSTTICDKHDRASPNMHIGEKFDPATVLTMPMPKLEHVKGYFVAKDISDKERTVGFTILANPEDTFSDLKEKIKQLQRETD